MKFKIDHDYHIHSRLSLCSKDENQTAENILKYAVKNNLKEICITDHFWSETAGESCKFYGPQNYAHISEILPLPQGEETKFYFGCETDMDKNFNVGLTLENTEKFDFIIIPTTHLHMKPFTIDEADNSNERRAYLYLERLNRLMEMDLPFGKIGIAHPTCELLAPNSWEDHLIVLDMISNSEFKEVYKKIADRGAGFELNFIPDRYNEKDLPRVLRPYKIAKEVGCKFYFGSDAHKIREFDGAIERANQIVDLLGLEETDRFRFEL